jgi:hypothetical protein
VFAIGFIAGGVLVRFLPAILLLVGPMIMFLRLGAVAVGVTPPAAMVCAIPIQIILGVTFCAATARKLRRDDVQAFGPWLGLLFLAEMAALAFAGLYWSDVLGSTVFRSGFDAPLPVLAFTSYAVLSLLALFPLGAAAQAAGRWERRRRLDPGFAGRAPVPYGVVAAAAVVIVVAPAAIANAASVAVVPRSLPSVLLMSLGVVTMAAFLRRAYARRDSVFILGLIFLLLTWVVPVLIEVVAYLYRDLGPYADETTFSPIIACSPLGAAFVALMERPTSIYPGLAFQVVLALLLSGRRARLTPLPARES